MKLKEIYDILNRIHDDQDIVDFESLIKLITSCKEIRIANPRIFNGRDIYEQYVYRIEIKIDNIDCNLWLYFYDTNNVTVQQIFTYNSRIESINCANKERMKLDFKPICIDERKANKILNKYW